MYIPHQIGYRKHITPQIGSWKAKEFSVPMECLGEENIPKRYCLSANTHHITVTDDDGRTFPISRGNLTPLLPHCVGGVISQPCVLGFKSDGDSYLLPVGSEEEMRAGRGFVRAINIPTSDMMNGMMCLDERGRAAKYLGEVYRYAIDMDGTYVAMFRETGYLLDGKAVTDFDPTFITGRETLVWEEEWTVELSDRVVYSRTKLEKRLDFVEDPHGSMIRDEDIIYTSENGVGAVFSMNNITSVIPYDEPFDGVRGNLVWMLDGRAFHKLTPKSIITRLTAI